jgi:Tol biopolymer transport system component/agmatine/peptidylarginine deiminase
VRGNPWFSHGRGIARSLPALALALFVLIAAAPAAEATFPGQNGKIAFDSQRGTTFNFDIYSMNADGTGVTSLTNDPEDDITPAWSQNGQKIAFSSERDGLSEVWSMNANGSGQTALTAQDTAPDYEPAWSPDGTKIAFVSGRDGNDEIYVMNADGSGQTRLTNDPSSDREPAFSPDGTKIAFVSDRDGNQEIYSMNSDGSAQTRLTLIAAADYAPNWNPNGLQIAFTSMRDGNPEIYRMSSSGGAQTRLTTHTALDQGPTYSPDGTRIAFESQRPGCCASEIFSMLAGGANVTNLTQNSGDDANPDWQTIPNGRIVVRLDSQPDDAQDFSFTAGGGLSPASFSLDDDADGTLSNTQTYASVTPASGYSIAETVPSAWDLTSATCDDGSPITNIDVASDETVTCTFTDRKRGKVIVVEDSVPDDAQDFSFTAGGGLLPSTFTLDDDLDPQFTNTQTYNNVVPGSGYSIAETVPSGWDLTSSTCSDGSPVASIDVTAGETVTCTFTNRKRGTIVVVKDAQPNDAQDFSFSAGGGLTPASFSLDDDSDPALSNTQTYANVVPGSGYSVAETVPGGWDQTAATCSDGSAITNVDLSAGETVTCTFTNRKRAQIVVVEDSQPDDPQDFSFTAGGGLTPTSFSLDDDADPTLSNTRTFANLTPGSGYSLSQTAVADWVLSSACSDGSPIANIDVSAGETVTCTFTNRKRGQIVVVQDSQPDDPQDFSFAAGGGMTPTSFSLDDDADATLSNTRTFSNLAPASGYALSQSTPPSGWLAASASCSDGSPIANIDVAPAETVTCTFTNLKRGQIVVVEDSLPDDAQNFSFTAGGGLSPASFSLDDDLDPALSNTQTFNNVLPVGGYSIAETVPSGWDLTSSACSDGSAISNIVVSPGETVTCTFTNRKRAQIVVVKDAQPNDAQDFSFSAGGGLTPASFTLDDDTNGALSNTQTFANVVPGSGYSVSETVPSSWDQSSATCDDGSPISNINASAGEVVTCTFTNRKRGQIVVVQDTVPNNGQDFSFTAGGGLSPTSFQLDDDNNPALTNTQTFASVIAGSGYSITQAPVSGWSLSSATCSDGSPIANIDVAPAETVTCTFTNNRSGHITVIKDAVPNDPQDFSFTAGGAGGLTPSTFALDDDADGTLSNTQDFNDVTPANGYSIAETVPAGWDQTSATCSDGSPITSINVSSQETVTCTVTNQKRGKIIVVEDSQPDDAQDFSFTTGGGLSPTSFQLDDDADGTLSNTQTFNNVLPAGGYSLAETVPSGWDLSSSSCSDGSPIANVNVAAGETVTCTFTNRKRGQVVVVEDSQPDDAQDFSFTAGGGLSPTSFQLDDDLDPTLSNTRTFASVVPASGYSLAETVPSGWDLSSATCSDGSPIANIDVAPAETVTCTFTNRKRGQVVVVEDSQPNDPQDFSFTAGGGLSPTSFQLDDDADGTLSNTRTFASVTAQSGYSLSETVPSGWDLLSSSCDDGSPISSIDVAPAETVTCTFTNRKRGQVVVVEDSLPNDAQDFSFTAGGGLSPTGFQLDDDADGTLSNTRTFASLVPGSGYSLAETVPGGWDLTSATCSDGSPIANIDVAAGETVTCTFTNRKRGQIVVVKDAQPNDAQDFSFAAGGGLSPGSFQLDDDADGTLSNTQTFANVVPGAGYSIAETVPSGWDQSSATCSDGSPIANIDVAAGETVTCTFTNKKRGQIVVVEDSQPDDAQDFSFTAGGGLTPTSFSLDDDADPTLSNTQSFNSLPATSGYSVSEAAPAGWDQTSATCSDGSPVTNIDVGPAETVTCTFTNRKRGQIVVVEDSQPDDAQDFSFTAGGGLSPTSFQLDDDSDPALSNTRTFASLPAQAGYSIAEAVPSGWDLSSASCDDGSPVTNINVGSAETVTCTFTNRKRGQVVVVEDSLPDDPQDFSFTAGGGLSPTSFQLDDDLDPTLSNIRTFASVTAQSGYSLSETVPSGWDLLSSTCDDGSSISNIDVAPAETVTCTFTNRKRGQIIVVEDSQPNDAQDFSFTAGGGLSPTSFQLDDDADGTLSNTRTFTSVVPASGYSLSETVPSGWDLLSSTCDDGSSISNIDVAPAETVTCTFTNRKRGQIIVVEDSQPNDAQDFSFTAGGGLSPTSFQLDDDADGTLSNTRTFAGLVPASGYSLSEAVPGGWDLTSATCSDGSPIANVDVAPGETVTCTFTNRKRGQIVVVKDAQPNDPQDFSFTAGGGLSPGSFQLDDDADGTLSNTQTFANVVPGGGYSIAETVPSGWDQSSATCSDGSPIANIDVAAGETVTCTFTNKKRGQIVIVKDSQPDDPQDFSFTAGGGLGPNSFQLDDDADGTLSNTQTFNSVPAASGYSVSEAVPSGWDQTSATCSDGSPATNIDVAPAETVTCTFTNRKRGQIVVVEDSQPDDAQDFSFTAGGGLSPTSFQLDDDLDPTLSNTRTFANIVPGSGYSLAETVPSGWDLSSSSCTDGSPIANVNISAGETVTCTFTNRKRGQIVVVEDSQPNDAQDFSFTAGGGLSPTSFQLDDDADGTLSNTRTFASLVPASGYSLAETVPSGWDLLSSTCDDGSSISNIDVAPAETVTCTFTNRKRGQIVVVEDSQPNDAQDFSFTAGGGLSPTSFQLDDDSDPALSNTRAFASLVPASGYTLAETVPGGWDLTGATCSDGSPIANIDVAPGETVTCTFTNRKRGQVVVVKDAQPNDPQDFSFTAGGGLSPTSFQLDDDADGTLSNTQTFANVVPGTGYSIAETVPSGWDQSSAACSDGSPIANIDVAAGETVTCTFTNKKRGQIVIVEDSQPDDPQDFSFTAGGGLSPASFQLDDDADGTLSNTQSFNSVPAASGYSVSESVPSGWDQTNATCSDGSPIANIDVAPAETVTCTFTNRKRGQVVVVEDSLPDDPQDFSFTAGGGLSPTSFQLDDDVDPTLSNTRAFANLVPGSGYSLAETVPSGWDLSSSSCSDGSPIANVNISAGETVTCTFTNRKRGQIVVVEDSQPNDAQDFSFTAGGGLSPTSFQLDDDSNPSLSNSRTFANVTAQSGYSVAETVPGGWDLTSAVCDDGSSISNIDVAPAETVTCTFTNRKRGQIVVVEDSQPNDAQDFSFTAGGGLSPTSFQLDDDADGTLSNTRTFASLVPGSGYSIAETVPGGWDLTSSTCDDGSSISNIDVAPAETVTCTFTNRKRGQIIVVEDSQPNDAQDFSFTGGGGLSPTSFQLDDDADGTLSNTRTFASLVPGSGFSLAETVPSGWDLSASCDDGSPIANIDVAAGETVTCTFTNKKRGQIVVVEDSQPNDAQDFSFTAGGGLSPTSFQLDDDADGTLSNTQTYGGVPAQSGYSVAETVPSGWDLSSATCSDGSPVSNIDVGPAETVTCTFTNRKRGQIVVVKDAQPDDPQDFSFTAGGGLSPTSFQLDDDADPALSNTRTFTSVPSASGYSIAETVPSGWDQSSATCDDGSPVANIDVGAGETVTCTFTNRKRGQIVVVEDSQPNDPQDFSFTAGGGLSPTSFQLDDDADPTLSNTRTFASVQAGSGYSLAQTLPSGWDLLSATCDDGSPLANIDVAPAETVTCTFTNRKRGGITVVEDSVPNDAQDFSFTAGGGLSPGSFQLDDDSDPTLSNTRTFSSITPGGGYSLSETVPSGWDQTSATCDDGSPVANIDVSSGETVTCTFTNRKRGRIVVVKDAQPNDPQDFSFTAGGGLSPASFQLDDDADPTLSNTRTFNDVVPGSGYSLSETVPSGWDQTAATCDDGSPIANIDVSAGETVTCTFTNRKRGRIVVVKDAQPNDPQDFSFSAGGGLSPGSFQLDDDSDPTLPNTQTFNDVVPGSGYSLSETVPSGWDQTAATCNDGSAIANIDVSAGETVTCTFTNRKRGRVVIVKDSVPDDPQDFSFTAGGGLSPSSFQLDDDADPTLPNTQTFDDVVPGAGYSIAETVPSGWDQSSATCSDGSPVANIDVGAGETVTCTFTNRKRGQIVVVEDSQPNDPQDFSYTAGGGLSPSSFQLDDDLDPALSNTRTFASVQAGSGYSLAQTLPSGWDLLSATCDDGSPLANIDVAPAETVTCTFTNRKRGNIVVVEDSIPDDPQDFSFTAGGGLSPTSFQLDDDLDPALSNTRTFSAVVPGGGYSLSETVPSGWDQASATCSDGSPVANIDVSAGETVTCTFTNRKRGKVVVVKDAQPNDPQNFSFTAGGGLSPSSFQLDDDSDPVLSNTQTFNNVVPGNGYSISETVPSGWDQTGASCDDGSLIANVDVSAGETVTCTFTNRKRGRIVIVKDAQPNDPQDFSFATGGGLSPSSFQLDDDSDPTLSNTQTFNDVVPGNGYSVSETVPSGWDQTGASCDDGSPIANVDVSAGETVTCTFTNRKRGRIVIVKDAQPNDPQDFSFSAGGGLSPGSFQLDDDSDPTLSNTQTFDDVVPGAGYSVAETVPAGWDQSSAACSDGSPLANIDVGPGETVTCTFTNKLRGRIVAVLASQPTDPQDFSFTAGGGLSPSGFQLDDDSDPTLASSQSFDDVQARNGYSLSQTVPAGWDMTSAICDDGSPVANIDVGPGETVTCTFSNRKRGKVVIVKDAQPDDAQNFTFTAGGGLLPSSFQLDDDLDPALSNTQTFNGVVPGSYSIAETVPGGWDQTGATCDDGSPVTAINVGAGETVTCTFTNRKRAQIVVVQDSQPNDPQDFSFTAGGGLSPASFQLDDDSDPALSNTRTFANVVPGSGYSLSQSVPAGWDLTSSACNDGSPLANIDVSAGEAVTCTFTNRKRGKVVVVKDSQPNDPQDISFTAGGGLSPASFQLDDDSDPTLSNTQTFNNVVPGNGYSLSESVPSGWDQASATCDDGSPVSNIDVAAGETVTCTFVNHSRGTIVVVKDAQPDDPQDFSFTAGGGLSPSSFQLDDHNNPALSNTQTFNDVVPGNGYSISETLPPDWGQASATCDDGSPVSNIDVAPGETVTCTFVNSKRGSIVIVTDAQPDDAQNFSFTTGGLSPNSFQLDDDSDPVLSNTQTFNDITAGSGYSVAESVPSGWDQASATCDDGSPVSNIDVSAGETVTCTFVNKKRGRIVIVKDAQPNDPQNFSFTAAGGLSPASFQLDDDSDPTLSNSQSFDNLQARGGYSVAESVPSGWDQASATCDDGSPVANIAVGPAETVTCTFTNSKRGSIVVVKDAQPNDAQDFSFTAAGGLSPSSFQLDDDADAALSNTRTFANVAAGSGYSIAETAVSGWKRSAASCDDGSPVSNIDVGGGETVTCTFVNTKVLFDAPQAASRIQVAMVPDFRQTISASQCQARGGATSTHQPPFALTSCNPPALAAGTQAHFGSHAAADAELTVAPGNLVTPADEADVAIAVGLTDLRSGSAGGGDYNPNPSGDDLTLIFKARITDTLNGASLTAPATVSDRQFSTAVGCAGTADPSIGSSCSVSTSADAVEPGVIKEGKQMVIQLFRVRLTDSGTNAIRGDADDRGFAMQGYYVR